MQGKATATDETKEAARRYLKEVENTDGIDQLMKSIQDDDGDAKHEDNSSIMADALRAHHIRVSKQPKVLKFTSEEFRKLMATMDSGPKQSEMSDRDREEEPPVMPKPAAVKKPQDRGAPFLSSQFDLERDSDLQTFIKDFYMRYTMTYYSDNEKDKASKLKIKVKVDDIRSITLTRNELDDYISSYRNIYKSFCNLRTFMLKPEVTAFDNCYSMTNYHLLNMRYPRKLMIKRHPVLSFYWQSQTGNTMTLDHASIDYLLIHLLPADSITTMRLRVIEAEDDASVIFAIVTRHVEFVEFLLKLNIAKIDPET